MLEMNTWILFVGAGARHLKFPAVSQIGHSWTASFKSLPVRALIRRPCADESGQSIGTFHANFHAAHSFGVGVRPMATTTWTVRS